MKKLIITVLISLSTTLVAGMFESSTDVKNKYQFDVATADKNKKLAAKLDKFQNDKVSADEIQKYLVARDDNNSQPFALDVEVDASLAANFPQRDVEVTWYDTLYESLFGTDKETEVLDVNASKGEQ